MSAVRLPTPKEWLGLIIACLAWSVLVSLTLGGQPIEPWVRIGGAFLLGWYWRDILEVFATSPKDETPPQSTPPSVPVND